MSVHIIYSSAHAYTPNLSLRFARPKATSTDNVEPREGVLPDDVLSRHPNRFSVAFSVVASTIGSLLSGRKIWGGGAVRMLRLTGCLLSRAVLRVNFVCFVLPHE